MDMPSPKRDACDRTRRRREHIIAAIQDLGEGDCRQHTLCARNVISAHIPRALMRNCLLGAGHGAEVCAFDSRAILDSWPS